MKLYRTSEGAFVEREAGVFRLEDEWDALINRDDLVDYLTNAGDSASLPARLLAPIGTQEVWAAGVTYERSRVARMEESESAASIYDRVYEAQRPELFFKASAWRVSGSGQAIRIRRDATWSVPEPEVALCVNARGDIVGYTIGNDVSSRDIEGDNPLYLPQAKIYDGACALGPAVLIAARLPPDTCISLTVERAGRTVFEDSTAWSRMRRDPRELLDYLYREITFPVGVVLLTGTGIVPPVDFRLEHGDAVTISVAGIGELSNTVS